MDQLDTGLISLKLDITVDQKRSVPTSCNQKRKQLLNVECGKYNTVVNTTEWMDEYIGNKHLLHSFHNTLADITMKGNSRV